MATTVNASTVLRLVLRRRLSLAGKVMLCELKAYAMPDHAAGLEKTRQGYLAELQGLEALIPRLVHTARLERNACSPAPEAN